MSRLTKLLAGVVLVAGLSAAVPQVAMAQHHHGGGHWHGGGGHWHGGGWGALWGLLFGALFFLPLVGAAAGAAIGGLAKATEGVGISKEQLETIRAQVTEGTSALFLVTEQGDLDRVGERFHGTHMKLVETNLTDAEQKLLLETFGNH